jgi:hypothetical protein
MAWEPSMKVKKAIKRLRRAESILDDVIGQYDPGTRELHDLLDAAKISVANAKDALAAQPPRKSPSRASQPRAARKPAPITTPKNGRRSARPSKMTA